MEDKTLNQQGNAPEKKELSAKDKEMIVLGYLLRTGNDVPRFLFNMKDSQDLLYLIDSDTPEELWSEEIMRHKEAATSNYDTHIEHGGDIQLMIKALISDISIEVQADRRVITSFDDKRLLIKKDMQIMPTGIEFFDTYLGGGFMKQTMTGIQTVTGGGKTTMMLTLGCELLKRKRNVAFVNLEVLCEDFNYNILSGLSEKQPYSYIKQFFNDQNMEFVNEIKEEIQGMDIGRYIQVTNAENRKIDILELEKILQLNEYKLGIKFDIVMIDYLFLLAPTSDGLKNEQNYDTQQRLTVEARQMAIRNNWAVCTVFQANRSGAKEGVTGTSMAGAFNVKFDMENYFFFGKALDSEVPEEADRDFISVKSDKHRYYDGKDFVGYMRYDFGKKVYRVMDTGPHVGWRWDWKVIYSIPDIYEKLTATDFIRLLEKSKEKGVYYGDIPDDSKITRFTQKNKDCEYCKKISKTDWKKVDIEGICNSFGAVDEPVMEMPVIGQNADWIKSVLI